MEESKKIGKSGWKEGWNDCYDYDFYSFYGALVSLSFFFNGDARSVSYRSTTLLPATNLSFIQDAIISSGIPGKTHVSCTVLLKVSLCKMLSLSTATAAPTCGSWTMLRNRRSLSGSSLDRIVISISSIICSLNSQKKK